MWTYVIAFRKGEDLNNAPFLMVRSRKRGGWEMPGGRIEEGETMIGSAVREFLEETGRNLETAEELSVPYKGGRVFFGSAEDRRVRGPAVIEILVELL